MFLYSPQPRSRYASYFPRESEIAVLGSLDPKYALAAWNWFWLLRPEFDLVLKGTPWHTAVPVIPGLLVAIFDDMKTPGLLTASISHPLALGEWLLDNKPACRSIMVGRRTPFTVSDPYRRCNEVAERMLTEQPFVSIRDGKYSYATED